MKKRYRTIISLSLILSLILSMNISIFAENNASCPVPGFDIYSVTTDEGIHDIPGEDVKSAGEQYKDVVFTSFRKDSFRDIINVKANSKNADCIRVYNSGTELASANGADGAKVDIGGRDWYAYRKIFVEGYDGHGEQIYINNNFFNLSEEELNELSLGDYYISAISPDEEYIPSPDVPVAVKFPEFHPLNCFIVSVRLSLEDSNVSEENLKPLGAELEIIHDNYDPTGQGKPQTWIKITFTPENEKPFWNNTEPEKKEKFIEDNTVPKWLTDPENVTTVSATSGGYTFTISMNKSVSGKTKKDVKNGLQYVYSFTDSQGNNSGGVMVKKIKTTKPKGGTSKVTFVLKGADKEMRKIAKGLKRSFKKVPVMVSFNSMERM